MKNNLFTKAAEGLYDSIRRDPLPFILSILFIMYGLGLIAVIIVLT